MMKHSQPLLKMMAVLSLSSCATAIHNGPLCSPFPVLPGQHRGDNGASCDDFLKPNARDLDKDQWEAEQKSWEDAGCVEEVTHSCFTSQLKGEIEKLCTVSSCTEAQKTQMRRALVEYMRLQSVSRRAMGEI